MTYVHRPWHVDVVGWTGTNFDEVKVFAERHFGNEVDARVTTRGGVSSFEFSTRDRVWTIRAGSIIVIHLDPDLKGKIEILPVSVFKRSYVKE